MPTSRQKRESKEPLIPTREMLLEYRWRINRNPEVCVRDPEINKFLQRHRGNAFQVISKIDGLGEEAEDRAGIFAHLLTGYRLVLTFAPQMKPGRDLSGNLIKTRVPGLEGDVRRDRDCVNGPIAYRRNPTGPSI